MAAPMRAQSALLGTSLLLYGALRLSRDAMPPVWLRDSGPSLLFFPVAFSLIGLAPRRWGGAGGHPVKNSTWGWGTLLGILLLEGAAPALGFGTADGGDVLALLAGALVYAVLLHPLRQDRK